jgi:hypothetical protein
MPDELFEHVIKPFYSHEYLYDIECTQNQHKFGGNIMSLKRSDDIIIIFRKKKDYDKSGKE